MKFRPPSSFKELLTTTSLKSESVNNSIDHISILIDSAWDRKHLEGIWLAQRLLDELRTRKLRNKAKTHVEYLTANSWAALRAIRNPKQSLEFSWDQPEMEKEVIHLRQALASPGFAECDKTRQAQILTNLGGRLSAIGRSFEALEYWNRALTSFPSFGMALGNKGVCVESIAKLLYDEGHQYFYYFFARKLLHEAANSKSTEGRCRPLFKGQMERIRELDEKVISKTLQKKFSLGTSKREQEYRAWCLSQCLFLNPLNELLGIHPIAATDVFGLPSIFTKNAKMPLLFRRFNLMRQEYIAARYRLFESCHFRGVHFSDRQAMVYDTLDYSSHAYSVEMLKSAFRSGYSVLDKVAFTLRDYFSLDVAEKRVSFRTVWFQKGEPSIGLHRSFQKSTNVPLRGLYWLSKDLFSKDLPYLNSIEPEATLLSDLRNHVEHKFLSVHDMLIGRDSSIEPGTTKITLDAFERKTLKTLRLARSAIYYLSLAIHVDQVQRQKRVRKTGISASMPVWTVKDKWKRRL